MILFPVQSQPAQLGVKGEGVWESVRGWGTGMCMPSFQSQSPVPSFLSPPMLGLVHLVPVTMPSIEVGAKELESTWSIHIYTYIAGA